MLPPSVFFSLKRTDRRLSDAEDYFFLIWPAVRTQQERSADKKIAVCRQPATKGLFDLKVLQEAADGFLHPVFVDAIAVFAAVGIELDQAVIRQLL